MSAFKTLARRIFLTLLGVVGFFLLFDRLLFLGFVKTEPHLYRNYDIEEKLRSLPEKEQYKVLIFGTSRAYDAIHPHYIQQRLGLRSYKEAFVGKGPQYNYYFYQLYRRVVGVPKLVVYGVDFFIYNIASERRLLLRFPESAALPYRPFSSFSLLWSNKASIDQGLNSLLNQWQEQSAGDGVFDPERNAADMEKFLGENMTMVDKSEPTGEFDKVPFFHYPGLEGEYFEKLMIALDRDRVTVVLVGLPDYIGTLETNVGYKKYVRAMKNLVLNYHDFHFFDYNQRWIFPLEDASLFINGGYGQTNSHLNKAGAELFNRRFMEDLAEVAASAGLVAPRHAVSAAPKPTARELAAAAQNREKTGKRIAPRKKSTRKTTSIRRAARTKAKVKAKARRTPPRRGGKIRRR